MFTKTQPIEVEERPSVLPRLKEVTQELARGPMTKVYKTLGGLDTVVRNLMSRQSIGVVDAGIPEGEMFPDHVHDDPIVEHIIVYEGRIAVLDRSNGKVQEVGPGEVCSIATETPHMVESIKGYGNVRLVAITIPKEPDFPGEDEE